MDSYERKKKEDERKEIIYSRHELVVKGNELIRKTRYSLSATEQKLLIYLISKIAADDEELKKVKISVKDYCDIVGIQYSGENYSRIKKDIKGLADKSWWIPDVMGEHPSDEFLFRWIESAHIKKNSGDIEIKLKEELSPYLLKLKANFTKYELVNVLVLSSKYSIRLYEILKSFLWQNYWRISLEEFRSTLNVEGKYTEFKEFRRRVLDPSVKEINKYTDLDVEYETYKKGRTIEGLIFRIDEKEGYQTAMDLIYNQGERLKEPNNTHIIL